MKDILLVGYKSEEDISKQATHVEQRGTRRGPPFVFTYEIKLKKRKQKQNNVVLLCAWGVRKIFSTNNVLVEGHYLFSHTRSSWKKKSRNEIMWHYCVVEELGRYFQRMMMPNECAEDLLRTWRTLCNDFAIWFDEPFERKLLYNFFLFDKLCSRGMKIIKSCKSMI